MLQNISKHILKLRWHSREVRKEAELIKKQIESWKFYDSAPERTCVEWITIDKASSLDLDDWIWLEKKSFWYSIYVSIADVAEIVKPYSKLDLDALSRATSVYLNTHTFHMFPEYISTKVCSLNHNSQKLAITTQVDLDKNFNILNTSFFESIFSNKKRFDYESFNLNFNNEYEEYHELLQEMHKIAKVLYRKRISAWANIMYRDKVTLNLWEKNYSKSNVASFIIQELMLLANRENAIHCYKEKINTVYRLHKPELKWEIWNYLDDDKAFYSYKNWYHFWLGENFYSHTTSPIRRYADLVHQRQMKSWIRWEEYEYNINLIREIILIINSKIEQVINLERKHNKEVNRKRAMRFLKKLKVTNYDTIWSVPQEKFAMLIRLFFKEPEFLNSEKISEEIIFRARNWYISKRQMWTLISAPREIPVLFKIKKEILEE